MHDDRIIEKLGLNWILFSNVVCCLRVHKLVTAIKVTVRLRWGRGGGGVGGIGALETTITSSLFVTIMVTIFIGRFMCMCMCLYCV